MTQRVLSVLAFLLIAAAVLWLTAVYPDTFAKYGPEVATGAWRGLLVGMR